MADVKIDSFTIESNIAKVDGEPVYRIKFHIDIFPMRDESAKNVDILNALEDYFKDIK